MKFLEEDNMSFIINKKKNIFIVLIVFCVLVSCNNKIIDYRLAIEETREVESSEFSFEKPTTKLEEKEVITKKDKDKMFNAKIKDLILKRTKEPIEMKGIYLPAYVAGNDEKFDVIFENIKNSEINSIIVDIKDELGRITIDCDAEIVKELRTTEKQIKNVKAFLDRCHEENIYVVARIACFLDNFATRKDNSMALITKSGKLYKDNSGYYWLNPFKQKTRDYIKQIALSAADIGFDEIQFDYFRFSTDRGLRQVEFTEEETGGLSRIEVLTNFAQEVYEELVKKDVFFSIDVYGSIINSYRDQWSIGQDYPNLIKYCDYICPMIYPSHYANGTFSIEVPDLKPYETIYNALKTSNTVIEKSYDYSAHYGKVRPWLQAFTANWLQDYMVYEKEQYREQIKAAEEAGFNEWIFWQGGGVYKWESFLYQ